MYLCILYSAYCTLLHLVTCLFIQMSWFAVYIKDWRTKLALENKKILLICVVKSWVNYVKCCHLVLSWQWLVVLNKITQCHGVPLLSTFSLQSAILHSFTVRVNGLAPVYTDMHVNRSSRHRYTYNISPETRPTSPTYDSWNLCAL